MSDPTDLVAINEVKFVTGYGVRVVLATPSNIKKTLDHRFGGVSYDDVLKRFGDGEMEVVQESDDVNLQELQQATMDAPVVTLVNAILADAAKRRLQRYSYRALRKNFSRALSHRRRAAGNHESAAAAQKCAGVAAQSHGWTGYRRTAPHPRRPHQTQNGRRRRVGYSRFDTADPCSARKSSCVCWTSPTCSSTCPS